MKIRTEKVEEQYRDNAFASLNRSRLGIMINAGEGPFELSIRKLSEMRFDINHDTDSFRKGPKDEKKGYYKFVLDRIKWVMETVSDKTVKGVEINSKKLVISKEAADTFRAAWRKKYGSVVPTSH
jgi:hypothetical protein